MEPRFLLVTCQSSLVGVNEFNYFPTSVRLGLGGPNPALASVCCGTRFQLMTTCTSKGKKMKEKLGVVSIIIIINLDVNFFLIVNFKKI